MTFNYTQKYIYKYTEQRKNNKSNVFKEFSFLSCDNKKLKSMHAVHVPHKEQHL